MGQCADSNASRDNRVTREALVDQVLRIKLTAEQKQIKLEREFKTQENLLI